MGQKHSTLAKRCTEILLAFALITMLPACEDISTESADSQNEFCDNIKLSCLSEHIQSEKFDAAVLEGRSSQDIQWLWPIFQNPDYPNGCEIASLAAVLQYNGFNISLKELSETYLPRQNFDYSANGTLFGPDPAEYYVGDPASSKGWYCFEHPLAIAANAYLASQNSDLSTRVLTGATMDELSAWLEIGVPVIVWFTVDYGAPALSANFYWNLETGERYIPYINLHCLVLTAIEENICRFADPLIGITEVDADSFEQIYTQMGRRALVITSAGDPS